MSETSEDLLSRQQQIAEMLSVRYKPGVATHKPGPAFSLSIPDPELRAWIPEGDPALQNKVRMPDGTLVSRSQWVCAKLRLVMEWEQHQGRPFDGAAASSKTVLAAADGIRAHLVQKHSGGGTSRRPGAKQ